MIFFVPNRFLMSSLEIFLGWFFFLLLFCNPLSAVVLFSSGWFPNNVVLNIESTT